MRVACLSDIHANRPALDAALAAAKGAGAEAWMIAGDVVGKGPHPAAVVDLVMALAARETVWAVRGNNERKILAKRASPGQGGRASWTVRHLMTPQLDWLSTLPGSLVVEVAGSRVLIVHGTPRSDVDYLLPDVTPAGLASVLPEPVDVLVCGHSHTPFAKRLGEVLVVNCGSVGYPYDGDPRGSLALLDIESGAARARIVRFDYDVEATAKDLAAAPELRVHPDALRAGLKQMDAS